MSGQQSIELRSRYRGAMMGLATGDALGTTLEFKPPGTFEPLVDMVGGGIFGLQPGQWTDDTSMALCLAESLVERRQFDPDDQMQRYLKWFREGYLSSTGSCFDIGTTIGRALLRYEIDKDPFAGDTSPACGGNGSLMRMAPIPLAFAGNAEKAIRLAAEMSRTTHAAPEPLDACRYYAGLIVGALQGRRKSELLDVLYSPVPGLWQRNKLTAGIGNVASGSFNVKQPPQIRGTGYVVDALEAALWSFGHTDSFAQGALQAVNLGDDADTTGAIYGQLAGAYYGIDAIPQHWQEKIVMSDMIIKLADDLLEFSSLA